MWAASTHQGKKNRKNEYSRYGGSPFWNAKENLRITSEVIEDILPVSSLSLIHI